MSEISKWIRLGLTATPGIGPRTARRGRHAAGGWVEAALSARRDGGELPARLRPAFAAAEARGRTVARACERAGVRALFREDPEWPAALEVLGDVPEVLFVRGNPGVLRERGVAVVGTRECSPRGRDLASRVGERLAEEGWSVISGLARGIDTAAHLGALAAAGDTVAVLGCGADVPYPPENRGLLERIAREGLVATEFPPGVEPRRGHFPRRNRLLAALAEAVLVVESRMRGGALVTVRHALDLGKEIFVVPGAPGTPEAEGPLALLRDGARAVRDAEDLLEDLGGPWGGPRPGPETGKALDAVRAGARSPAALARSLGIDAAAARDHLARLELQGLLDPGESSRG
jgi:DNA processing protein